MTTPDAHGWMPIETAPKGVDMLVCCLLDERWAFDVYLIRDEYWREDWDAEPTHWHPLPQPPVSEASK